VNGVRTDRPIGGCPFAAQSSRRSTSQVVGSTMASRATLGTSVMTGAAHSRVTSQGIDYAVDMQGWIDDLTYRIDYQSVTIPTRQLCGGNVEGMLPE
jgi:hypothetical protein